MYNRGQKRRYKQLETKVTRNTRTYLQEKKEEEDAGLMETLKHEP